MSDHHELQVPADSDDWHRKITVFLSGQIVSLFGSSLVQYAITWHIAITLNSAVIYTVMVVVAFLPQAIISIFAGVWADRLNRKLLVVGADAVIALVTLILAIVFLSGIQPLWLVFAVLFVRSLGAGIQMPAVSALLPQLVPTGKLIRVNGINISLQSAMLLLSPAIAAALYASVDLSIIFFIDVVTAVIGISLVASLRIPRITRTTSETPKYFDDLTEGIRYVKNHPLIRRLMAFFATAAFLAVPASFLAPLYIIRAFGPEVWKLSAMEVVFSVGMLAGGTVVAAWGGLSNRMTMITSSAALFGACTIGLGLAPNLWIFLVFMGAYGLVYPAFSSTTHTLIQERVEPERQGRVFGLVGIVLALSMPVGMLIFGPLGDVIPIAWILMAAGALTIAVAVVVLVTTPPELTKKTPQLDPS